MRPKVGVALPVYNGRRYLERCLTSLQAQTYGVSVYIVDDGSTDETMDFLLKRPTWYTEYRNYPFKGRQGWPKALNLAAKAAIQDRCELIFPMACDDFLRLDAIQQLTSLIFNGGYDWALCYGQQVGGEDVVQVCQEGITLAEMATSAPLTNYGLYPTRLWHDLNGYPTDVGLPGSFGYKEDHAFHIKLMQAGATNYGVVKEPLYYYVMHPGQLHEAGLARDREAMELIRKRYGL